MVPHFSCPVHVPGHSHVWESEGARGAILDGQLPSCQSSHADVAYGKVDPPMQHDAVVSNR